MWNHINNTLRSCSSCIHLRPHNHNFYWCGRIKDSGKWVTICNITDQCSCSTYLDEIEYQHRPINWVMPDEFGTADHVWLRTGRGSIIYGCILNLNSDGTYNVAVVHSMDHAYLPPYIIVDAHILNRGWDTSPRDLTTEDILSLTNS